MPDDLLVKLGGDSTGFDRAVEQAQRSLRTFSRQVESISGTLTGLGTRLTGAVTLPLVGVGLASVKLAGHLEQNRIAFQTMLGSAEAAQRHLEQLRDFAARTPFQFTELVDASKRLQALGFTAAEVIPTLTAVGNAAAAMGSGKEGIDRITLALGQMRAKGLVSAEEMRQLAEAGIPAWQILANTLETDVAGAMKMVQARAVDAGTAVPALLAGINEKFGGLMDAQSKTLLGRWSNMRDRLEETLTRIGELLTPLAETLVKFATDSIKALDSVRQSFEGLPKPIKQVAEILTGLAIAAGPVLLALGLLGSVVANIAKLGAVIAPMIGVIARFTASLEAMAGALGAVGFALMGGLIGKGLADVLNLFTEKEKGIREVITREMHFLNSITNKGMADYKETIDKQTRDAVTKFEEQQKKMVAAAAASKKAVSESLTTLGIEPSKKIKEAVLELHKQFGTAADITKGAVSAYATLFRTWQAGAITAGEFRSAMMRIGEAFPEMEKLALAEIEPRAGNVAQLREQVHQLELMGASLSRRVLDLHGFRDAAVADLPIVGAKLRGLNSEILDLQDPFAVLGVTAQKHLDFMADQAAEAYQAISTDATQSAAVQQRAFLRAVEAQMEAGRQLSAATRRRYEEVRQSVENAGRGIRSTWNSIGKQISTVLTDLSRGIADAIVNFKSLGDLGVSVIKQIAQAIIRMLIEEAFDRLRDRLAGLHNILGAIGRALGGVAQQAKAAGTAIGQIPPVTPPFAGGTIPGVTGPGTPPTGTGSPTGGGIPGTVGLPEQKKQDKGILDTIFNAANTFTGILGLIGQARQEGTLNAIEANTRIAALSLGGSENAIAPKVFELWQLAKLQYDFNFGVLHRDLVVIMSKLDDLISGGGKGRQGVEGETAVGSGGITATFYITNQDPKATAREVARALKELSPKFA